MVRVSVLADCLKTITNAEKRGKRQVLIRPSSKVVVKFLQKMQENGKNYLCFCKCVLQAFWSNIWGFTLSRERDLCVLLPWLGSISSPLYQLTGLTLTVDLLINFLTALVCHKLFRLYWWIHNCWWSPCKQDCSWAQWTLEQVRSHQSSIWCTNWWNRTLDCKPSSKSSVRTRSSKYNLWYYDTWGS